MQVSRRQFFKVCGAGLSGSSIALMGFSPTSALAEVRSYKLHGNRLHKYHDAKLKFAVQA